MKCKQILVYPFAPIQYREECGKKTVLGDFCQDHQPKIKKGVTQGIQGLDRDGLEKFAAKMKDRNNSLAEENEGLKKLLIELGHDMEALKEKVKQL